MFSRRFLRIKVVKALYAHLASEAENQSASEKNLLFSIDKAYELYFHTITLITEVRRYAAERIEIGRNKKLPTPEDLNPNTKFIDNAVVLQIENDAELNSITERKGLGWSASPDMIKYLYNRMVESDYYAAYMASPDHSYEQDRRLVADFFVHTIQDDQRMIDYLEESSIMWCDDLDFILIMILHTLDSCRARQTAMPLEEEYKNDDDRQFVKLLFRNAVSNSKEYTKYIERFTRNWDVERIAFMDTVIMICAIAEMISIESVPVKVTLDEYIEISKYYSTVSSANFINGILDKVVETLTAEGVITKAGRGLIG